MCLAKQVRCSQQHQRGGSGSSPCPRNPTGGRNVRLHSAKVQVPRSRGPDSCPGRLAGEGMSLWASVWLSRTPVSFSNNVTSCGHPSLRETLTHLLCAEPKHRTWFWRTASKGRKGKFQWLWQPGLQDMEQWEYKINPNVVYYLQCSINQ